MQHITEWLDALQVGDVVAVYGHSDTQNRLGKIEAIQKLHFVVGTMKYRRKNGRIAGNISSFYSLRIGPATPEFRHRIAVRVARETLRFMTEKLSDDAALRIAKLVRAELKKGP